MATAAAAANATAAPPIRIHLRELLAAGGGIVPVGGRTVPVGGRTVVVGGRLVTVASRLAPLIVPDVMVGGDVDGRGLTDHVCGASALSADAAETAEPDDAGAAV